MSGATNTAHLDAIFGAQESGKSSLMKSESAAAKPARAMYWDPKREYGKFGGVTSRLKEVEAVVLNERRFSVVYQIPESAMHEEGMQKAFDFFCRKAVEAANLRLVVDELADVTKAGWAPRGWQIVTRQGRHARLVIQGASQRPADVDKSFYGNCSRLVVFRLNAEGDVDRMAKALRKPAAEVAGLAHLEFFERDMKTGLVVKKKLTAKDFARIPS